MSATATARYVSQEFSGGVLGHSAATNLARTVTADHTGYPAHCVPAHSGNLDAWCVVAEVPVTGPPANVMRMAGCRFTRDDGSPGYVTYVSEPINRTGVAGHSEATLLVYQIRSEYPDYQAQPVTTEPGNLWRWSVQLTVPRGASTPKTIEASGTTFHLTEE